MTVFNRPVRVLWNTLHALKQNNLKNCEILIVDDGSTIDYECQKQFCDQYEMPVRWMRIEASEYPEWTYTIPHPDGGVINNPALAMNRAIAEANGKRLMFLSSDCMIPKFAVDQAKKCSDYYWIASVMDQASNIMYVCDQRPVPLHFFSSCKKEHVEAIGGFDENYLRGIAYEDNDFGVRLGLYCRHVVFDQEVMVVHQSHPPLSYSDKGVGLHINEDYTMKKWGSAIPWNCQRKTDSIHINPVKEGLRYRCNPTLREGFPDPLNGKRR
jgi:glycosyltransferase involved in cell wall biosynthesis